MAVSRVRGTSIPPGLGRPIESSEDLADVFFAQRVDAMCADQQETFTPDIHRYP
jgi:hypothetical protein